MVAVSYSGHEKSRFKWLYGRFNEGWREPGIQSGTGRIAPRYNKRACSTGAGTRIYIWCRRRDLNPHGLRHTPLKRACLPFHHFGTQQELEKLPQLRSRITQTLNVLSGTPRAFARCGLVARLFEAPATEDVQIDCHVVSRLRFLNDERQSEGAAL